MSVQFAGDGEILAFVLMESVDRWMMNLINIESMTCCYKVLYMLWLLLPITRSESCLYVTQATRPR